jgi:tetratricopeptide (TPR) repeat protein
LGRTSLKGTIVEAEILASLGRALSIAERPSEALAPLGAACHLDEQLFGADSALLGDALLQLGFAQREVGMLDQALASTRRAADLLERSRGEGSPSVVEALVYVGEVQLRMGRATEAIAPLERAALLGERYHTPYPDVPRALALLGQARLALGQRDLAQARFEEALAHPMAGSVGAELGRAQLGLAKTLWPDDRARSLTLAHAARATLAGEDTGELRDIRTEVDAWLAEHDPAPK